MQVVPRSKEMFFAPAWPKRGRPGSPGTRCAVALALSGGTPHNGLARSQANSRQCAREEAVEMCEVYCDDQ